MQIFTATGNNGLSIDSTYSVPATINLPNLFTIAASTEDHKIADWSNYGTAVDYACPGTTNSTYPGGGYGPVRGTSYAAPFAAGLMLLDGMPDYELTTLGLAPNYHDPGLPDVPILAIQPAGDDAP